MMTSSFSAPERGRECILFEGQWTVQAARIVSDAVAGYESTEPEPARSPAWVCVTCGVGPRRYFLAHRLGGSEVLKTHSASALALAIASARRA